MKKENPEVFAIRFYTVQGIYYMCRLESSSWEKKERDQN